MTGVSKRHAAPLLAVLLSACASAPKAYDVDRSRIYPAPFDATWNALVDVFNQEGWPIDQIDKQSGFISTGWADTGNHPGWSDCGSAALAIDRQREGAFRIFVREEPGGTRVDITSNFRILREGMGQRLNYDSCNSTGMIEQRIHVLLLSNLRAT
jgi:hypothetical protein